MMIETDVLYAYVKSEDWLKPTAEKLIERIEKGEFGEVYASREVLHELYYVSMQEGISLNEFISRVSAITAINNLKLIETDYIIDLLAFTLMQQYNLTSLFDAYYAATALNKTDDRIIISTDNVFDKIPGLRRIDPRELIK
ncbi:MAG: type II toxin-antitoxin system VapC family toxin [archaeon GB-1867-035]|nr:type II toxin-antitoxin system VapC family toxin [Candidatus Culexmicrobium profundum]